MRDMVAEPATKIKPNRIAVFPRQATRSQITKAVARAATAAIKVHKGACCATAMAATRARGAWYRNGRMIKAGRKKRPVPANTKNVNRTVTNVDGLRESCME